MLDLTRFVAGSQTTALLAALGADVIKLEVPPAGDPYRVQGTERLGDESVLFLSLQLPGSEASRWTSGLRRAAEAVDRLLDSSRLRGGERASGEPRSLRLGLGGVAVRAIPRSSTGRSRGTATSVPGSTRPVRPDPAERERRHERDGIVRFGAGEGQRAPVLDVGAGDVLRVRTAGRAARAPPDRCGTPGFPPR